MKSLYFDHHIFTPDIHTGKNVIPAPVRPGSIFFWDEADTRDGRLWFSLTQLLAALHPYVGYVFIAPGALGTMCFRGPSRINGPVGLEQSITSTFRWGGPPFHSRIGFFELICQLLSSAKCLKTAKWNLRDSSYLHDSTFQLFLKWIHHLKFSSNVCF